MQSKFTLQNYFDAPAMNNLVFSSHEYIIAVTLQPYQMPSLNDHEAVCRCSTMHITNKRF